MKPFTLFRIIILLSFFGASKLYAVKPTTAKSPTTESVANLPAQKGVKDNSRKLKRKTKLVERFKEKFAVLFSKDNEQKNKNLETKRHGLAVASMVLGIVGFLTASVGFGLILCLLAVIFGSIARKKIKNSGGFYTGKGMAIAGLVLGIIPLAVFVVALFIALALGGF